MSKKSLLNFLLIITSFNLFAQNKIEFTSSDGTVSTFHADISQACDPGSLYTIAEKSPAYESGDKGLVKDLNKIVSFDKSTSGETSLYFAINCEGKAYGFQSLKGISEEIDAKIIQALEILQNWTPGTHRDIKVDFTYILNFIIKKGKIKII